MDELLEYLISVMPDAKTHCDGDNCNLLFQIKTGVARGDKHYCSQECADRANAILIKPQPKAFIVDGWDV